MSTPPLDVEIVVEQLRRPVPGGIGTYCRGLLAGLALLGSDERPRVTLRASRGRSGPGAEDPLRQLGWPLRTSALPGPLLSRVWDRGVPLGWLHPSRSSVLHGTSFATPPVRGMPLVVMVHDLAWRRFPDAYPARGRAWHESALRRVAGRAAAFVVPSGLTASDLLATGLGIGAGQVHVIPEGVDHLDPPDDPAAQLLLARLGVPAGGGYLLTVSTLEPRKNLSRLVEAYSKVRPSLPEPWPLVIVGPSGWGDSSALAAGSPGVFLAGRVDGGALSALFTRARCVAYVPLFEGFGLPAGEAMASGAPVVATEGLPSSAGAALEVDPLDTDSIAGALLVASVDGGERRALVSAGHERARELSWRACAVAHVEVWEEVASSARGSSASARTGRR
ncbi:MAG: glycosyltransferase family 4 protein [Acidimicrobiales bacterium]